MFFGNLRKIESIGLGTLLMGTATTNISYAQILRDEATTTLQEVFQKNLYKNVTKEEIKEIIHEIKDVEIL